MLDPKYLDNFIVQCNRIVLLVVNVKLFSFLFFLTFCASQIEAQAPQAVKYQTVLRSGNGQALVNRPVQFGISIQQGFSGPIVYQERHTTTTNAEGLVVMEIGRGVLVNNSPAFNSIDWSTGSYFEVISIDTSMNNNFIQLGSFELLSVPYTLHSGNGLASGTQLGQMSYWDGVRWILLPQGNNNQELTFCNNQPIWAVGGQCPAILTTINCMGAVNSGAVHQNQATSITSKIAYTGGNGGYYPAATIPSSGVTGLTASIAAGNVVNGNDTLTYTITGTPIGFGTANFAISVGGQSCTLAITVIPVGAVTTLNCGTSTPTGSLVIGVLSNSVSSTISYSGGNGGLYSAQTISSTGVSGLTAVLSAGTFVSGSGSVSLSISGTPNSSGTATFSFTLGGQSCTLNRTVDPALLTTLSCGSAIHNGTLTNGIIASGVSSVIPYSGGNGGLHTGGVFTSTGVTGLTATVSGGYLAVGSGTLTFTITGTPSWYGVAFFTITIGGQTCTFSRSIGCNNGFATPLVEVTSTSGMIWMDRNLGAERVAQSSTDSIAYGHLYQWGRNSDGHQCRVSPVRQEVISIDNPGHGDFILNNNPILNWRSPKNDNLWQGVNGINNPCPTGFRLPTQVEWQVEYQSWSSPNAAGAIASPIKLTLGGIRTYNLALLHQVGSVGYYYHSTLLNYGDYSGVMILTGSSAVTDWNYRTAGASVRCRKN